MLKRCLLTLIVVAIAQLGFGQTITQTAKNDVSSTLSVYTFKYEIGQESKSHDNHPASPSFDLQITDIRTKFLGTQGVTRCTFDKATNTFTVLAQITAVLTTTVNTINGKK